MATTRRVVNGATLLSKLPLRFHLYIYIQLVINNGRMGCHSAFVCTCVGMFRDSKFQLRYRELE